MFMKSEKTLDYQRGDGFDLGLGVLIEVLKEKDYDNTIIAISGDHGSAGFPYVNATLMILGQEFRWQLRAPELKVLEWLMT